MDFLDSRSFMRLSDKEIEKFKRKFNNYKAVNKKMKLVVEFKKTSKSGQIYAQLVDTILIP